MKSKLSTVFLVSFAVFLTGCANEAYFGVTGWNDTFSSGSYAPDIPFTTKDGKEMTLHQSRESITVIVFTDLNQEHKSLSDLVRMSEDFKVLPLTIVQVIFSIDNVAIDGKGRQEIESQAENLVLLCDENRIAWKSYGQPQANTVFLIDQDRKIRCISHIDMIDDLVKKAEHLAWESRFDGC